MSKQVNEIADTIIVGGGVIGLATALELVLHDVKVTHVFPSDGDATSASRAAGAMLGAFGELTADDGESEIEELEFRLAAQRYYPAWLEHIVELSGASIFQAKGSFIIANNQGIRDRDSILRIQKEAAARGEPAEWVEPNLVPGLNPSAAHAPSLCLYLANEHSIHSGELLDALVVALSKQKGYTRIDAEVKQITQQGAAWRAVLSNDTQISAQAALLAGGSRSMQCLSEELQRAAGMPKLYFGKGVSCLLSEAPEVHHTIRTPNRAFACGIHVVPRPGKGNLYLGATNFMGEDHEAEKKIQPAELHGLFDETIHQINTAIRTSRIDEFRTGFRPIAAFKRPAIGRSKLPNLFLATGTYRNGILMAPLVARLIANEMRVSAPEEYARNPFALDQQAPVLNPDLRPLIDIGVRDIVAFLQEPRSPLPFNRSAELEAYMRSLFEVAVLDDETNVGLRKTIRDRISAAPFNETMHMLFYELVEKAAQKKSAGRL